MIVIPTYNERENVVNLVQAVRRIFKDMPILFVDDNSPDGTAAKIQKLQKTDKQIHLLQRAGPRGIGPAYREAFKKIISKNATAFIATMDADLSHDPAALPAMIAALDSADAVIGSRYIEGGKTQAWGLVRRLISRAGNIYARLLLSIPIHDLTSGMAVYNANALRRINLNAIKTDGYAFLIELKYRLYLSGALVVERPIVFTERREGRSKFSLRTFLEGVLLPFRIWVQDHGH